MPVITIRERTEDGSPTGRVLISRDVVNAAALLTHCAANAVNLTRADLRPLTNVDGANISGLIAPKSDWRGVSALNVVADRRVAGRVCELSASLLQGAVITSTAFTFVNLACTQPTALRATVDVGTNLRGVDWSRCPDVLELPISKRERLEVGRVVALRDSVGWKVHAGARGCLTEAEAKVTLAAREEYAEAIAYLDSAEAVAAKAAIEARAVGTGEVVQPTATVDDAKPLEETRTR